jgi:hypothetical protein
MLPNPLWFQGLPAELRRRLELAEAAAREARSETHAEQAVRLVATLAQRLPFDEAVARYIEVVGLSGDEAEVVRTRALAMLNEQQAAGRLASESPEGDGRAFEWRDLTPRGAVRFVRRRMRRSAEEDLWLEFAAALAEEALIRTHVEHALIFVGLFGREAPPPRSISYFLERLAVPAARARSVYQRALAQIADDYLPRRLAPEPHAREHTAAPPAQGRPLPLGS